MAGQGVGQMNTPDDFDDFFEIVRKEDNRGVPETTDQLSNMSITSPTNGYQDAMVLAAEDQSSSNAGMGIPFAIHLSHGGTAQTFVPPDQILSPHSLGGSVQEYTSPGQNLSPHSLGGNVQEYTSPGQVLSPHSLGGSVQEYTSPGQVLSPHQPQYSTVPTHTSPQQAQSPYQSHGNAVPENPEYIQPYYYHLQNSVSSTSDTAFSPNGYSQEGGQIHSLPQSNYHVASPMSPEGMTTSTEFSGSPGLATTLSAPTYPQDQQNRPQINILEIADNFRFRYHSEMKSKKSQIEKDGSTKSRSLGKIELVNLVGQFKLLINLVDPQCNPHPNELRLISKKEGYSQMQNGVLLQSCCQRTCQRFELPNCNIMRAKKGSGDQTADGTRVRIMFSCCVGDQLVAHTISEEINDSKGTKAGGTILKHINPSETRFSTPVDITILGDNITTKHKVRFYKKNTRDKLCEIPPHLVHKKCAVVVKTPASHVFRDQSVPLECQIVLCSDNEESNPVDFVFNVDLVPRAAKRKLEGECNSQSTQDKIRQLVHARKINANKLRTDSVADEEDKEEAGFEIYMIAFDVVLGEIRFDELLCHRLGMCPRAMLQKDERDNTPLALAITTGKHEQAKAFLSHMPPRLANELLTQRLGDAHVTHLLLMAYWPSGELPLALLTALLKAGSDPEALDTEGNSLLHLLIRNEQHAALEAILSKDEEMFARFSAVLDRPNTAGFAPLHEAVHRYHPQAVSALLSAGANVNVASRSTRFTCLHYAALETDPDRAVELTRLLLTGQGLKINEQTLDGRTATDMAEERKIQELLDLLKENGGQCLFEPSEDSDDDEDDDEEEEEEEEKEEKSQEEDGATAAAPQASEEESLSWADAQRQLLETLSAEDFRALGRALFSANQSRLLERAGSPGPLFLRLLTAARRRGEEVDVAAALRRLGRAELAELMGRANEE